MVDIVVYGKVIIDSIRVSTPDVIPDVLGGGGPQAAFGARVWNLSVGFSTRIGKDFGENHRQSLLNLDIDISGVTTLGDLPTLKGSPITYDANEYAIVPNTSSHNSIYGPSFWRELLERPITLPATYAHPKAIHLVSEYPDEPMMLTALEMRRAGVVLSLEPLVDHRTWSNKESMLDLFGQVDVLSPDWPTASGIAASDDPAKVMSHWSKLGPALVAIRHGKHGSYVWDSTTDMAWHTPAMPIQVADPTGGGNAYGGGLIAGWLRTPDARMAGACGAVSASFLVERIGMPEWFESLQRRAHKRLDFVLDHSTPL